MIGYHSHNTNFCWKVREHCLDMIEAALRENFLKFNQRYHYSYVCSILIACQQALIHTLVTDFVML